IVGVTGRERARAAVVPQAVGHDHGVVGPAHVFRRVGARVALHSGVECVRAVDTGGGLIVRADGVQGGAQRRAVVGRIACQPIEELGAVGAGEHPDAVVEGVARPILDTAALEGDGAAGHGIDVTPAHAEVAVQAGEGAVRTGVGGEVAGPVEGPPIGEVLPLVGAAGTRGGTHHHLGVAGVVGGDAGAAVGDRRRGSGGVGVIERRLWVELAVAVAAAIEIVAAVHLVAGGLAGAIGGVHQRRTAGAGIVGDRGLVAGGQVHCALAGDVGVAIGCGEAGAEEHAGIVEARQIGLGRVIGKRVEGAGLVLVGVRRPDAAQRLVGAEAAGIAAIRGAAAAAAGPGSALCISGWTGEGVTRHFPTGGAGGGSAGTTLGRSGGVQGVSRGA